MSSSYDRGDQVRLTAAFKDTTGALADPGAVTCRVRKSDGTITVYAVPTIVKDSVGNYHLDLNIDLGGGNWAYRFEGTLPIQTAEETQFYVRASAFYP